VFAAVLVSQLLLIVGIWQFTKPDPPALVVGRSNIAGWAARSAGSIHILVGALMVLELLGLQVGASIGLAHDTETGLLVAAVAVEAMALAFRCRSIARRLPSKALAWQLFVLLMVLGVILFGSVALSAGGDSRLPSGMVCWDVPVVGLWLLLVLLSFAAALTDQVPASRARLAGELSRTGDPL
jgi:hypothetical protein